MRWEYLLIIVVCLVIAIAITRSKKKDFKLEANKLIMLLGGKDNVIDYEFNKSRFIVNLKDVLNVLNKKYKLIMLTNNFPSIIDYLKNEDIYDLFDKVYVSSIYETSKNEEKFFDMVINDYNIKESEALFIDDFEDNLDIGIRKKLNVVMLDRENKKDSKYKKISNLVELEKIL